MPTRRFGLKARKQKEERTPEEVPLEKRSLTPEESEEEDIIVQTAQIRISGKDHQNKSRAEGLRTPEEKINRQQKMLNQLLRFSKKKGFTLTATYHRSTQPMTKPNSSEAVTNQTLPKAYVFDLDGTLCNLVARDPHDYHLVHLDEVFPKIKELARMIWYDAGDKIILCSARPETCKSESIEWLRANYIPFDEIHFRKFKDSRPDYVIKEEIWNDISTRYDIQMMVDDRDQVVAAARKKGYTVAQVAYGNF